MPEPPDPRVDELRQRLRALGYLDAGVDRFVLGPARGTRKPAAIAVLASLRTGVIAAVLLGPAAAIGLSGRLPGLVTSPRDAVVIALYMGVLFGVAVSIVAFAASLVVSVLTGEQVTRRAHLVSAATGSIVTLACLTYLTLWWRTANAGLGWSAPVWTGFALTVAVAISLLLGHAVMVTTLAVVMSRHTGQEPSPAVRSAASWKPSIATGILAFAGAAMLLVATTADDGRGTAGSGHLTVVSSGLRVRLVAIDGFDPGVFEQLAAAGKVPALGTVFSSTRARLAPEDTRDPARVWTTIATGQPPEVHGIRTLETRRVAGVQGSVSGEPSGPGAAFRAASDLLRLTRPAIASGTERREKALWEVASDAGLRTAVLNWWATWPAANIAGGGGIILTDRATLRLERGGPLDAEIAPVALYERLRQRWPSIRDAALAEANQSLASSVAGAEVRTVLRRSAELDAIQLALAREVSDPRPDLVAVYLPGLDIAQHALLSPGEGARSPSTVAVRLEGLREYYVCLDRLLRDVLVPSADELVVVVTEPGRVTAAGDGLMGIHGQGARHNAMQAGRSTDVMPTVLHALGVPISRTLAGTPLTPLLAEEFMGRYPVRQVASYGRPSAPASARTGQPLDQEMVDRLRSLGYVR